MQEELADGLTEILITIDKCRALAQNKEKYSPFSYVLSNIKRHLSNGTKEQMEGEIGKERFRQITLQLAHTLKLFQRLVRGKIISDPQHHRSKIRDLNDLTTELIRLEVDLIPDLDMKKERLLAALNESRHNFTSQKIRLQLHRQLLEADTNIKAEEKLQKLYLKHRYIIDLYLTQSSEDHSSIKIIGLESALESLLPGIFSRESYDNAPQRSLELLQSRNLCLELPIQNIYIHLKVDPTSSFERRQAQQQLYHKMKDNAEQYDNFDDATVIDGVYDKEVWSALRHMPIMSSIAEHDRTDTHVEPENVLNIIRNRRWTVVLGDPGSGKTTFVRWIVNILISSLLSTRTSEAPSNSPDDLSDDASDTTSHRSTKVHSLNIGPRRLPILIRVGEFADALRKRPDLTLYDYLGQHTWMGNSVLGLPETSLDSEQTNLISMLKLAIQDYIKHGMAFIILDGLDEIPISTHRAQVVKLIENFVETHVRTPDDRSVFDQELLLSDKDEDKPIESGGNQVVITSRIVGYHAQPLRGEFTHYTINPLQISYIQQFIYYWYESVYKQIIKIFDVKVREDLLDIETKWKNDTHALRKQINERTNSGLFNLATNPCLLNFICSISFAMPGARLPSQRICLYDATVRSLMKLWINKNSALNWNKLDSILCDIAAYIHANNASGLIEEPDLIRVCTESLTQYLRVDSNDSSITEQVNQYLEIFRTQTGVLAQRGQHLYGFLHLTFQEYYASKSLVDKYKLRLLFEKSQRKRFLQQLAEVFHRHLSDPRYRMILALSLGWISWKHNRNQEFEIFIEHLIGMENAINQHLPLGALLLVTSVRDLKNKPPATTLFKALNQILVASADYRWHRDYEMLQQDLASGLNNHNSSFIRDWVLSVLTEDNSHQSKNLVFALCHLLVECGRQLRRIQKNTVSVMDSLRDEDDVEQSKESVKPMAWADSRCFNSLTSYLPFDNEEWEYAVDSLLTFIAFSNQKALTFSPSSLRETLLNSPSIMQICRPVMMTLIIALCGGLYRRETYPESSVGPSFRFGRYKHSVTYKIEFSPLYIHRESSLDYLLKMYLTEEHNKLDILRDELIQLLQQIQPDDGSLKSVEIFIALFCINGIQSIWFYEPYLSFKAYQMATQRFKRILIYLRQFYYMYIDWDVSIDSDAESWTDLEDIDTDLQQLIDIFLDQFQNEHTTNKQLFAFLHATACARARLCTTNHSFLNPHSDYETNNYELKLPDNFCKIEYLHKLLYSSQNRKLSSDLPYFIRLLWSLRKDTILDRGYGAGNFGDDDIHTKMMFYQNDKDQYYALAFATEHLLRLYDCLIESQIIIFKERDLIFGSNQLPFTHVLFDCVLNLSNPSYYNKGKSLAFCILALLPLLRFYDLHSVAYAMIWKVCRLTKDTKTLSKLLQASRKIQHKQKLDLECFNDNEVVADYRSFETVPVESIKEQLLESIEIERSQIQNVIDGQYCGRHSDYQLYCAAICLEFLYSSLNVTDADSLQEISNAILLIQNPVLKLNALTIIEQNATESLYLFNGNHIHKEILQNIAEITNKVPPMLFVLLLLQCLPVLHDIAERNTLIISILDILKQLSNQKQQEALLSALVGVQNVTLIYCPIFPLLERHRHFQCLPFFKANVFQQTLDSSDSAFFLSQYRPDEPIPVFLYSMYLAELANEVQLLSNFSDKFEGGMSLADLHGILTYSKASAIHVILSSSAQDFSNLDEQMYEFSVIETRAQGILKKWLTFYGNQRLHTFACHAALLLCENEIWNASAIAVVCDLLVNKNDRFRERAIRLISLESSQKTFHKKSKFRLSSVLGLEVLTTLIAQWRIYRSSSSVGTFFLSQVFVRTQIDDVDHLEYLLELELSRIRQEIEIPVERQVSFFTLINNVSLEVMEHFVECLLRLASEEATNVTKLFVKNLCKIAGVQLLSAMDDTTRESQESILVNGLFYIVSNTAFDEDIRQSGLENMSYIKCYDVSKFFVDIINDTANYFSVYLISTAIRSLCTCLQQESATDLTIFRQLLSHPCESISATISCEIGRVCQDVRVLLEFFDGDYRRCYYALLYGTSDIYVSKKCASALVQLIEHNPSSLLPTFVIEMFKSVRHFTNIVHANGNSFEPYINTNLLETLQLLIQKMPAAIEIEIDRSGISDQLKETMYYTSKQHDHLRRINCINILSSFRELTPNLCDMIIEAQLDTVKVQQAANQCVSRISRAQPEAVQQLFDNLKSESLIIRKAVASILIMLVEAKVVQACQVQAAFLYAIDRDHSDNYQMSTSNHIIYNLLVKMSYPVSTTIRNRNNNYNEIDEMDNEIDELWIKSCKNWLIKDFNAAEEATHLAFCLVSRKHHERNPDDDYIPIYRSNLNSDIRNDEYSDDEDVDDDNNEERSIEQPICTMRVNKNRNNNGPNVEFQLDLSELDGSPHCCYDSNNCKLDYFEDKDDEQVASKEGSLCITSINDNENNDLFHFTPLTSDEIITNRSEWQNSDSVNNEKYATTKENTKNIHVNAHTRSNDSSVLSSYSTYMEHDQPEHKNDNNDQSSFTEKNRLNEEVEFFEPRFNTAHMNDNLKETSQIHANVSVNNFMPNRQESQKQPQNSCPAPDHGVV